MQTIKDIGEKELVRQITRTLPKDPRLLEGFGHDSAFLDISLKADEVLMLNTDRSGSNIAYKLGLANGSCVGDFAISHAVSDIFASGGEPIALSVALLLPDNLNIEFVKEVMLGAQLAAQKYGAFIASGDTKHNNKFAIVVSVLGKCKRTNMLTRSGAQSGDLIVAIGEFGAMLSGLMAYKNNIHLDEAEKAYIDQALIYQNPPFMLSKAIAQSQLAHACMDNSDGLSSTINELCHKSNVGSIVYEEDIPLSTVTKKIAKHLNIKPFQLCLGSGDWQHIYAVKKEHLDAIKNLGQQHQIRVSVIGEFTKTPNNDVLIQNKDGLFKFNLIENDRFQVGGTNFFDLLENPVAYLGEKQL